MQFRVDCSKDLTNLNDAWSLLSDFGSDWHPDIAKVRLVTNDNRALIRDFTGSDGNRYVEQRTYISHSDQVIKYRLLEGIKEVKDYQGVVDATGNLLVWSAEFSASEEVGPTVAEGTKAILQRGLDWLSGNPNELQEIARTKDSSRCGLEVLTSEPVNIKRKSISGMPTLSILTADPISSDTLVIFLHGIGGCADNWLEQLQATAAHFLVAALDTRGYGDSNLGETQSTVDDYCVDIHRILDHFNLSKVVLVGLSMGSWIATSFAMRHPELVAGLILADGCTGMSEARVEEREAFLAARAQPLAEGKSPKDFANNVVDIIAGPSSTSQQRAVMHASMAKIPSDTYLDAITCFANPVETFDFKKLVCPVLLVTGEYDKLAPPEEIRQLSIRMYEALLEGNRLPDIEFEVIKNAGHLSNIENPQAFNRYLTGFLNRIIGAEAVGTNAISNTQSLNMTSQTTSKVTGG